MKKPRPRKISAGTERVGEEAADRPPKIVEEDRGNGITGRTRDLASADNTKED
jgi:hypothetical protein